MNKILSEKDIQKKATLIQQILNSWRQSREDSLGDLLGRKVKVKGDSRIWTVSGVVSVRDALVDLVDDRADHWDNKWVGDLELI